MSYRGKKPLQTLPETGQAIVNTSLRKIQQQTYGKVLGRLVPWNLQDININTLGQTYMEYFTQNTPLGYCGLPYGLFPLCSTFGIQSTLHQAVVIEQFYIRLL